MIIIPVKVFNTTLVASRIARPYFWPKMANSDPPQRPPRIFIRHGVLAHHCIRIAMRIPPIGALFAFFYEPRLIKVTASSQPAMGRRTAGFALQRCCSWAWTSVTLRWKATRDSGADTQCEWIPTHSCMECRPGAWTRSLPFYRCLLLLTFFVWCCFHFYKHYFVFVINLEH